MMECDPPEDDQTGAEKRKLAAQKLIERYYYQLTVGCGATGCDNPDCKSSGNIKTNLQPNEAAARALGCLKVTELLVLIMLCQNPVRIFK